MGEQKVIQVNMHEAKTQLSQLAERVWAGDRVIIAKAGVPYLDLTPHKSDVRPRQPGALKDSLHWQEDWAHTPPELIAAFEGRETEA